MKKNYSTSKIIDQSCFKIVPSEGPQAYTKKQKYEMILFENHLFKRLPQMEQTSLQLLDKNISCGYICVHSSHKCRCGFVVMNDGSGKLISDHQTDIQHLMDIHNVRRYELKIFINSQLDSNPSLSPQQLITEYIRNIHYQIDCFSPDKRYISFCISNAKRQLLGKLPKKIDNEEFVKLKENIQILSERSLIMKVQMVNWILVSLCSLAFRIL